MKKRVVLLFICALVLVSAACGNASPAQPSPSAADVAERGVDVDLTQLSSTMVYSEVNNMLYEPESYLGKSVRMNGTLSAFLDVNTGALYYGCIVADATACCSQGLEFVLAGEPDASSYPEPGTEITVTGTFGTYEEDGILYCRLNEAELQLG